jgi:hypothetical protein
MKNILIFAGIAGLAAAIAIYFVSEGNKDSGEYISDAAVDAYDQMNENMQRVEGSTRKPFHSMS